MMMIIMSRISFKKCNYVIIITTAPPRVPTKKKCTRGARVLKPAQSLWMMEGTDLHVHNLARGNGHVWKGGLKNQLLGELAMKSDSEKLGLSGIYFRNLDSGQSAKETESFRNLNARVGVLYCSSSPVRNRNLNYNFIPRAPRRKLMSASLT